MFALLEREDTQQATPALLLLHAACQDSWESLWDKEYERAVQKTLKVSVSFLAPQQKQTKKIKLLALYKERGCTYPRNGETSCTSSFREITSWLKITRQRRKFSYASVLRRALRT